MINWYKDYDSHTFMKPFEKIDFRPYNPNHEEEKALEAPDFKTIFDNSYACNQMLNQFRLFIKDQITLKPLKDPFSEICIRYCRQSCEVIFLETQNAHLNVPDMRYFTILGV